MKEIYSWLGAILIATILFNLMIFSLGGPVFLAFYLDNAAWLALYLITLPLAGGITAIVESL